MISSPSTQVPSPTIEELNVNLTIDDRSKEAGYGYFRGCTVQNWRFLCSTMPYSKWNACVFLCLNSSTANQNQGVSHDQDTSHSYHRNEECHPVCHTHLRVLCALVLGWQTGYTPNCYCYDRSRTCITNLNSFLVRLYCAVKLTYLGLQYWHRRRGDILWQQGIDYSNVRRHSL